MMYSRQEVRNHVAKLMLRCTVYELFEWRFMQTDPNWGNFLFDRVTGKRPVSPDTPGVSYDNGVIDDLLARVYLKQHTQLEAVFCARWPSFQAR